MKNILKYLNFFVELSNFQNSRVKYIFADTELNHLIQVYHPNDFSMSTYYKPFIPLSCSILILILVIFREYKLKEEMEKRIKVSNHRNSEFICFQLRNLTQSLHCII